MVRVPEQRQKVIGAHGMANTNNNVADIYEAQLAGRRKLTAVRGMTHSIRATILVALTASDESHPRRALDTVKDPLRGRDTAPDPRRGRGHCGFC